MINKLLVKTNLSKYVYMWRKIIKEKSKIEINHEIQISLRNNHYYVKNRRFCQILALFIKDTSKLSAN